MGWLRMMVCLKSIKRKKYKQVGVITNGRKNATTKQLTENVAATIIQSAYRSYKARKVLQRLRGIARFRGVIQQGHYLDKSQASSALNHIHFWSRIQAEIKARWMGMVTDGRLRQKKLENQLKVEAKLHELEVEWSGGPETMEEILSRIQQREEAATKRERAMAYAFSHQWRANSSQYFGQAYYDLSKETWGWSWKERWIAARPWENRVQATHAVNKKLGTKHNTSDITKTIPTKDIDSVKTLSSSNGKIPAQTQKSKVPQEAT